MVRKYWVLLVIALAAGAGVFFLLVRFGLNDRRAVTDFSAAYQQYDQAVSAASRSVLGGAASGVDEQKADAALAELKTKASARISSLTKNDGQLMKVMPQIAGLSGQELDALQAYREAAADQSADMETLANQFRDLTRQRQVAYARFLELVGQNK